MKKHLFFFALSLLICADSRAAAPSTSAEKKLISFADAKFDWHVGILNVENHETIKELNSLLANGLVVNLGLEQPVICRLTLTANTLPNGTSKSSYLEELQMACQYREVEFSPEFFSCSNDRGKINSGDLGTFSIGLHGTKVEFVVMASCSRKQEKSVK